MNVLRKTEYRRNAPQEVREKATYEYIRQFSYLNGLKASIFTINGKRYLA